MLSCRTHMHKPYYMKKYLKHLETVVLLLAFVLSCGMAAADVQAQTCEGRICLKSGERRLYVGDDRMEIPRKKHDVEAYRRFFSHQCQREAMPADSVDSVVVWNAETPQSVRVLVPLAGVGWSWRYVDRPRLQVYVYSSQGYSLNALGGITASQGNTVAALFLIPGKTACDFYAVKAGGEPVCLGDVYKRCDKAFVRKLCRVAGIGAGMEEELLRLGEVDRSAMVQMVADLLDEQ